MCQIWSGNIWSREKLEFWIELKILVQNTRHRCTTSIDGDEWSFTNPPTSSRKKNGIYQRGWKCGAEFGDTNVFLASDPPTHPPPLQQ